MCVVRKTSNMDEDVAVQDAADVRICTHRIKKSLFRAQGCTKKWKDISKKGARCEECSRQNENSSIIEDYNTCVTCGAVICDEHVSKHSSAARSDDFHVIMLHVKAQHYAIRCHSCEMDLEPSTDDPKDNVKVLLDQYKSLVKLKAVTKKPNGEDARPVVEGKKDAGEAKPHNGEVKEIFGGPGEKADKTEAKKESVESASLDSQEVVEHKPKPHKQRARKNSSVHPSVPNGDSNSAAQLNVETYIPAKGLPNLGNTCFFNSVMQCIMHTHHLQYYVNKFGRKRLLRFDHDQTVTVNEQKVLLEAADIEVPDGSIEMNNVLRNFLAEFFCKTSPSPNSLFAQIAKKAPRFKGWAQQDAHELLRYLLDGLRSEEQDRYRAGILAHFGLTPKVNPKNVDKTIANQAKGYMNTAGRPLLDAVFGGTLLQTIRCCQCGHVSERQEQFLDLSLPVSSNPMSAHRQNSGGQQKISKYLMKKNQKAARKEKARNSRAQKNKSTSSNGTTQSQDINELVEEVAGLDVSSDDDETESSLESEGEEERVTAGADPLDYTKVLAPPPASYSHGRSVGSCLLEFTAEELLSGNNAYECEKCCTPVNKQKDAKTQKKRVDALKRYLIFEPPSVLTLHLKRFQQTATPYGRVSMQKMGGHVDFPLLFDIAPFTCKTPKRVRGGVNSIQYSLYGVVSHSGGLSGGHYVAYVKSRNRIQHMLEFLESARSSCVDAFNEGPLSDVPQLTEPDEPGEGQWYFCSDSRVNLVAENRVLSAEAYILFYERIF